VNDFEPLFFVVLTQIFGIERKGGKKIDVTSRVYSKGALLKGIHIEETT
jgi:hypothetical protein